MVQAAHRIVRTWLVVGAFPSVVMPIFHLLGFWQGKHDPPRELGEALEAMDRSRFDLMGSTRSMTQLYDGFNLSFALLLLMAAALTMAAARRTTPLSTLRVLAAIMTVGQLGLGLIAGMTMAVPLVAMFGFGALASLAALAFAQAGLGERGP